MTESNVCPSPCLSAVERAVPPSDSDAYHPFREGARRFRKSIPAVAGLIFVTALFLLAVAAPLLANGRPLLLIRDTAISSPAASDFFAPDAREKLVEIFFNYLLFALIPVSVALLLLRRSSFRVRSCSVLTLLVLLVLPFFFAKTRVDRTNWRVLCEQPGVRAVFAPIPYGPNETSSDTFAKPSFAHPCGTDQVGRDVLARMIYGARVSLAVGVFATLISMTLGTLIGLISGYFGGKIDLIVQRLVEIVICFPSFLLLLILMSLMLDYGFRQSILLVILVLGLNGWTGLCRLVRGEVLKQRSLAYIHACESLGVPKFRILLRHLLPNVSAPLFVSFAFEVAGAILAENGLSFLGFGVQEPTSSWGELLRQAFSDPLTYWNLMLWPGLAIFLSVIAFNFIADGVRSSIELKS